MGGEISITIHFLTRSRTKLLLTFYVLIEFELSTFVLKCHVLRANIEIQTN